MAANTDYDAPRATINTDSLEELKARRTDTSAASADIDDTEPRDGYGLPGAELLDEELTITVIQNEFRCDQCFLVRHHNQRHQPATTYAASVPDQHQTALAPNADREHHEAPGRPAWQGRVNLRPRAGVMRRRSWLSKKDPLVENGAGGAMRRQAST